MAEDDYDLVPHHDVELLKKDMDEIKKGNFPGSADLLNNLHELNDSLRTMTALFQEASASIKVDEKGVHEKLEHKLDTVIEQNTKIAEGIVAVADMIKEMNKKHEEHHEIHKEAPKAPSLMNFGAPPGAPPMPQPAGSMPPPIPGPTDAPADLGVPPMPDFGFPEEKEEKKGFFSKFRKKK